MDHGSQKEKTKQNKPTNKKQNTTYAPKRSFRYEYDFIQKDKEMWHFFHCVTSGEKHTYYNNIVKYESEI